MDRMNINDGTHTNSHGPKIPCVGHFPLDIESSDDFRRIIGKEYYSNSERSNDQASM